MVLGVVKNPEQKYNSKIDESGEDYWHAADMFYRIEIPNELARTLHGLYQAA